MAKSLRKYLVYNTCYVIILNMSHAAHEQLDGQNDAIRRTGAYLGLAASILVCGLANPKDATAHQAESRAQTEPALVFSGNLLPSIGILVLARNANLSPAMSAKDPTGDTQPITEAEKYKFLTVAMAQSPNSPCNTQGYTINLLPALDPSRDSIINAGLIDDPERDPRSDMRTSLADGTIKVVQGRANGNCDMDLLNMRTPGVEGEYEECVIETHEARHLDISLSPIGFVSTEPGRDPNGDIRHDKKPGLMWDQGVIGNYAPCLRVTVDRQSQSIEALTELAIDNIPALSKARAGGESVECSPLRRKPLMLCYSATEKAHSEKNGRIIKILSRRTKDGRPKFASIILSNRSLRRYLSS